MERLKVASVMTRDVYAVAPDTSIETAARLLATQHITGVPVVNANGRPVGVITLTDLSDPDRARSSKDGYPLFYRIADGASQELGDDVAVGTGQVADMMSPFVLSIESSATVVDAAKRMLAEAVHRLLVMDGNALVGIVTATDLLEAFVKMSR